MEAACNDPEVFERVFCGATIKRGRDGKPSRSPKTEEDARKCDIPSCLQNSVHSAFCMVVLVMMLVLAGVI